MAIHDLTPELRTRLSSVERMVGWFVTLAAVVLLAGFAFYIYSAGKQKGWFETKINYATSLDDASGLKVGDPVMMMGFKVGEITMVEANEPNARYGVTVGFWIKDPYFGYIWLDSVVRLNSDLLGHTSLEVLKGKTGKPTATHAVKDGPWLVLRRSAAWAKFKELRTALQAQDTNAADPSILVQATNQLYALLKPDDTNYYVSISAGKFGQAPNTDLKNWCYLPPLDEPSLSERMAAVAGTVERALPNILDLTNKLNDVLTNAAEVTIRLNQTLADLRPTVTNVAEITGHLRDPNGSLGNWLLPTNLAFHLQDTVTNASATLAQARVTMDSADTNLIMLATDLDHTLIHLSDLTSNLAWQASINTNLVTEINTTIYHTDDLIQGLKRHWLLRSAFRHRETNTVDKAKRR